MSRKSDILAPKRRLRLFCAESTRNFKDLYACRKDLGGGILLTESHEINMIIDLFGLNRITFNYDDDPLLELTVKMTLAQLVELKNKSMD